MSNPNPFSSNIKQISLGSQTTPYFPIIGTKIKCQYEKIEFIESVFELFPSGSLVVRDTTDIATSIRSGNLDTIKIEYGNGKIEHFFITSVSGLNNLASSNEENFIAINFSNQLFKINQNRGLTDMSIQQPSVENFETFLQNRVAPFLSSAVPSGIIPPTYKNLTNTRSGNYVVIRPLNPIEEKLDIPSQNLIQYLYYLSSMLVDDVNYKPRFLFWTGFNNDLNLRYVGTDLNTDPSFSVNDRSYYVYEGDNPTIIKNGITYKKIYLLFSTPSSQYYNRNYFYVRKTPAILDDVPVSSYQESLFKHQFLDDGNKYNVTLVSDQMASTTTTGPRIVPSLQGYSEIEYEGHFGYYNYNDKNDNFSNSTTLMMDYGNNDFYDSYKFMTVNSPYPFIDNPEMWKNVFDLTSLHPNLGGPGSITSPSSATSGSSTNLQKVLNIRQSTKNSTSKKDLVYDIEKQNFIYYVLCCISTEEDEQEETFFAALTGFSPDTLASTNQVPPTGSTGKWRYTWTRLDFDITSISSNFYNIGIPENNLTTYPNNKWILGTESNSATADTWAINLNERKNWPGDYSYGAPGWWLANLTDPLFQNVRYRPIGYRPNGLLPGETIRHIVKMHKVPYSKILKESPDWGSYSYVDQQTMLNNISVKGRYVYYFELPNATDGPCIT
jgi:hypothetical protein